MKNLLTFCMICLLAVTTTALARDPVPLVELRNAPLASGSGKPLTLDDVRDALDVAAQRSKWTIRHVGPGQATATTFVNGKHSVAIAISYSPTSISIEYRDSVQMKYGVGPNGDRVIHPSYMDWQKHLYELTRFELHAR